MLKPAAKTAGGIQESAGPDLTPEAIKEKEENLDEIRSYIKDINQLKTIYEMGSGYSES